MVAVSGSRSKAFSSYEQTTIHDVNLVRAATYRLHLQPDEDHVARQQHSNTINYNDGVNNDNELQ